VAHHSVLPLDENARDNAQAYKQDHFHSFQCLFEIANTHQLALRLRTAASAASVVRVFACLRRPVAILVVRQL